MVYYTEILMQSAAISCFSGGISIVCSRKYCTDIMGLTKPKFSLPHILAQGMENLFDSGRCFNATPLEPTFSRSLQEIRASRQGNWTRHQLRMKTLRERRRERTVDAYLYRALNVYAQQHSEQGITLYGQSPRSAKQKEACTPSARLVTTLPPPKRRNSCKVMDEPENSASDHLPVSNPTPHRTKNLKGHASEITAKRGLDSVQYRYAGQLPPAEQAQQWAKLLPDAPDRILAIAEREQQHDHSLELAEIEVQKQHLGNDHFELEIRRYEIESNLKARTLGTVCVSILVTLLLALSAYMVHEKQGLASLVPLVTAIGTLAVIFITGKQRESKPKNSKVEPPTLPPLKRAVSKSPPKAATLAKIF